MGTFCSRYIGRVLLSFSVALALTGNLLSGVVPGRWEKLAAEPKGAEIRVVLKTGEEMNGSIQEVAADYARVRADDGREISLQKTDISRVVSRTRHDRLQNGALTGAAIGGSIGLVSLAYALSESGTNDTDAWFEGGVVTMIGFVSGLFIGAAVDAARRGDLVLYQAP